MILKKQLSVLIALLVLVSNSGLAFNVHYCEGEIASISSVFTQEEICDTDAESQARTITVEDTCCAKIEITHNKCCSDKKVDLKSKTEKIVIKTISFDFEPAFFAEYHNPFFVAANTVSTTKEPVAFYCDSNAPPLYQLYCQYTFYA
ncbi:HYC_CC_PP family protein [Flavobacterium sedimenticola]|uniref:Uncharacterized protein n=1 Tax=Flavobacterium sedimenticola TaxID=3043286 RepID=A0ABT6XRY0_9FLAO|nr:hypothetical protein [Flavobacterium sedimenticola]MDI9257846.1 hypothetical protein [Flavobacterium sedimenticola]